MPARRNMLVQRPVAVRGSWTVVRANPFYLDAALYGGRMTYDVPITPIE